MIDSRHITIFAAVLTVLAVFVILIAAAAVDHSSGGIDIAYEDTLFNTDETISVNILMSDDDWENMMDTASSSEYSKCDIEINGQTYYSVGIRPKGNSSLLGVTMAGSERYSFRIKFDEYIDGQSCDGLDTLVLNNNFNDTTQMREAVTYDMFQFLDADASLYNYASVSRNGEYHGVYLALECVEESFLLRSYGTEYGQLYKPDNANLNDMGGMMEMFGFRSEAASQDNDIDFNLALGGDIDMENFNFENFDRGEMIGTADGGSSDDLAMALNYVGDDLDSYEEIWSSSKFKSSESDHRRVVTALKNISESNELDVYMDVDNILKYMAVQTFVYNLDGLTGSMAHNYYLYEENGKLNLIPWDYNGAFDSGTDPSAMVNFPIDTPFTVSDLFERSFFMNLLADEEYLAQYHTYLRQLAEEYVYAGEFEKTYSRIRGQIDKLTETDPTSFTTYESYSAAADELCELIRLRADSVRGQLDGTIPSTREGQEQQPELLTDVSSVDPSVLGGSGMGMLGEDFDFEAVFDIEAWIEADTDSSQSLEDGKGQGVMPENVDMETLPMDFDHDVFPEKFGMDDMSASSELPDELGPDNTSASMDLAGGGQGQNMAEENTLPSEAMAWIWLSGCFVLLLAVLILMARYRRH